MHDILFLLHASHCCSPPPSSFLSILPPSFLHRSLHFPCIPPTLLPHSYLLPIIHPSFTLPPSYTLLLTSVASLSFVRLIRQPYLSPYFSLIFTELYFFLISNITKPFHTHTHSRCNRAEEKTKHRPTDDFMLYKCDVYFYYCFTLIL